MNRQPCTTCDGRGFTTGCRPACCGNFHDNGECRGHCAVPEPVQEQCTYCGGTGDGHRTLDQVKEACGPRVALAVDYLSYDPQDKGETREDYIARLGADNNARAVKLADLEHNMDLGRLKRPLKQTDLDRSLRYADEHAVLMKEHIRRRFAHWVKG